MMSTTKGKAKKKQSASHEHSYNRSEFASFKETVTVLHTELDNLQKAGESSKLTDPDAFNNAVRKALDMPSILIHICGIKDSKIHDHKKFTKIQPLLRTFLKDIVLLTKSITDSTAIQAIISHGILPIIVLFTSMDKIYKPLIKQLSLFWATNDEKLRVLAFIALYRIMRIGTEEIFDCGTEVLYRAYLVNCQVMSANTVDMIQFMRTSLKEVYLLNESVAYRNAFINITQLALLLRNAILSNKEYDTRTVYHWQYLHTLKLWEQITSSAYPNQTLDKLVYPIIQIALGILEIQKSTAYYPVNFHLFKVISSISRHTHKYVPVLSHMLQMLTCTEIRRELTKSMSSTEIEWDYIFKLNAKQMSGPMFGVQLSEKICFHILDYLSIYAASMSFPELSFVVIHEVKRIKKHVKQGKIISILKFCLDTIKENNEFIIKLRQNVSFKIEDSKAVNEWEAATLKAKPPLLVAFNKLQNLIPGRNFGSYESDAFSISNISKGKNVTDGSAEDMDYDESGNLVVDDASGDGTASEVEEAADENDSEGEENVEDDAGSEVEEEADGNDSEAEENVEDEAGSEVEGAADGDDSEAEENVSDGSEADEQCKILDWDLKMDTDDESEESEGKADETILPAVVKDVSKRDSFKGTVSSGSDKSLYKKRKSHKKNKKSC